MKTQLNTLLSGSKNQILNSNFDYSKMPQATSHVGHSGSNSNEVNIVWEKIKHENPDFLEIEIKGIKLKLSANWSLSRKNVSYYTTLTDAQLTHLSWIVPAKDKNAYLNISHATTIEIGNGKNSFATICPTLINIL